MNTKNKFLAVVFSMALMAMVSSCNKDDDAIPKPVISNLEVGIDNSHVAYAGADLHLEAEIVAEGRIDKIKVEIHQEEGSSDEIVAEYDEYSGLKNTTFHKHVDIPETVTLGTYHCHITVSDMEGNSTTVEEEITIEEINDTEAPVLTFSSTPTDGQAFANGETISISGHAEDNITMGGILIALVYESDNIADADVDDENSKVIVMLHNHDFGDDPDEYDFDTSIVVGAANDNNVTPAPIQGDNAWKTGNYYILVKAVDSEGNWGFSQHYNVVLN